MKLLQKILSHGLLIAFLVAVFFLYQERAGLFPQWFGKSAQHASAPVKAVEKTPAPAPVEPKSVATETAPVAAQNVGRTTPAEAEGVKETPVAAVPGNDVPAAEAVTATQEPPTASAETTAAVIDRPAPVFRPLDEEQTESTPAAGTETVAADAGVDVSRPATEQSEPEPGTAAVEQQPVPVAEPAITAPPMPEPVATKAPVVTPPVTEMQAANTVTSPPDIEPAAVEPAATAASDTAPAAADPVFQSRLEQARSLFWQRKPRAALQAYRGLTADYPNSAQAWGELGNLYFNLRQAPAAANAYARAIDLLIAQGEFMRAHQLLGVMYRLDARQARQLESRLRQTDG